jgi:two-component system, sensor histidine kinase and response regulator
MRSNSTNCGNNSTTTSFSVFIVYVAIAFKNIILYIAYTNLTTLPKTMEILLRKLHTLQEKASAFHFDSQLPFARKRMNRLVFTIKSIGRNNTLDPYEKRKLAVFNILNFFQLITGLLVPLIGLYTTDNLPGSVWFISSLPALISAIALYLNYKRKYEQALLAYFILYPFFTCVVYINGINAGIDLSFVLFGILAVFFLQNIGYMLFSIAFSMLSYFILAIVLSEFRYDLSIINQPYYFFNQLLIIGYIFYGLWLIKKENTGYQLSILAKNKSLRTQNIEIIRQQKIIARKAEILRSQTDELTELNNVKNKLFSIISHDLKAPMYALRNLFRNVNEQKMPAKEIKAMMPDVLNEFNYSISLMENLLNWAKSQMQNNSLKHEDVDITNVIDSVIFLLKQQALAKKIKVANDSVPGLYLITDREMLHLVLRNLLSNAIKFTPEGGSITIGINDNGLQAEVYVKDSGAGMSEEHLAKLQQNIFFTTRGTAGEPGTGLGLMLCREFLKGSASELHISSKPGAGSTFAFCLPKSVREVDEERQIA